MNLKKLRDYLKTILPYDGCWFGLYRLDTTRPDKGLCLYLRTNAGSNNIAIGGIEATGYRQEPLKLLIRWGKNGAEAEDKAREIYDILQTHVFEIDGLGCYIQALHNIPVPMGADDKGVYEYVIDFEFYYKRGDE